MKNLLLLAILLQVTLTAQDISPIDGTIIYRFGNGADGAFPAAPLIADASGNLYGTTGGYAYGPDYGSVFRLKPPQDSNGKWEETTLHSFHGRSDGAGPLAALVLDPEGNLYGSTSGGGPTETGVIFELSPPALGGSTEWTERVLHNFSGGDDGADPAAPLVRDAEGSLFGVTAFGGTGGRGVVFKLSISVGTGAWSETVLYSFEDVYGECVAPENIVLGSNDSLYGVCYEGGSFDEGEVFSLTPSGSSWTHNVIYSFPGGITGYRPVQITFGPDGNLYGTTMEGGIHDGGLVFELIRPATGSAWSENTIYYFPPYIGNHLPSLGVGVTFGPSGVIYGSEGDGGSGFGSVYQLTPPTVAGDRWTETPLYAFSGGFDGSLPAGPPVVGFRGLLYGTTAAGGYLTPCANSDGCGTAYAVKP